MATSTHVRPTVLAADGRFAAAIEISDGHTIREEYKYLTFGDAEARAKEWFEEIAAAIKREKEGADEGVIS